VLRNDSGSRGQLVLERTRRNPVATHRERTVTIVSDVSDAALTQFLIHTPAVAHANASGDENARWREWKRKGREEDARFRRIVRTVFVDVAGVGALGGALWFASVSWL
jgi:hypothetical protein